MNKLQSYDRADIEKHLQYIMTSSNMLSLRDPFINYCNTFLPNKPTEVDNFIAYLQHESTKMEYGRCWAYISHIIETFGVSGDSGRILTKLKERHLAEKLEFISDWSFRTNCVVGRLERSSSGRVTYEVDIYVPNEEKTIPKTPIRRLEWMDKYFDTLFIILPDSEEAYRELYFREQMS